MTHLSREFGLSHMGYLAIFLIGTGTAHVSAQAQSAEQPKELQAIYACKVKTNSDERLACYDAAIGNFETAEKSGEIITFDTQENKSEITAFRAKESNQEVAILDAEKRTKKNRGLFGRTKKPVDPFTAQKIDGDASFSGNLKEVDFEISRTKAFGRQKTRFYLTNGQVWEQTEDYDLRIPKVRNGGKPHVAHIKKAALGSYLLTVNGRGRSIKVKRVK